MYFKTRFFFFFLSCLKKNSFVFPLLFFFVSPQKYFYCSCRADVVDLDIWERKHLGMVLLPSGEWGVPAERLKRESNKGPAEVGEAGLAVRMRGVEGRPMQIQHSKIAQKTGMKRMRSSLLKAVPMRNEAATETVVQAPGWLVSGWVPQFGGVEEETGAWGFWNLPEEDPRPPTAVAHVVGVGGSKPYVMMAYGWWTPTVSPDLRGGRFITAGPPLKPVRTESMADFYRLLMRLTAVAVQADGVAVVPLVDCASPWILKNHGNTWMGVVPIAHPNGATLVLPARCPRFPQESDDDDDDDDEAGRGAGSPRRRLPEDQRHQAAEEVCCHFLPRDVTCMGHNKLLKKRRMLSMGEFLVGRKRSSLSTEAPSTTTLNVDNAVSEVVAEAEHLGVNITTATVAAAIVAKLERNATTSGGSLGSSSSLVILQGEVSNLLPPVGFAGERAAGEWRRFNRFPLCQLEDMLEESSREHQVEEWHNITAREYRLVAKPSARRFQIRG